MKYFLDAEFIEYNQQVILISLALVSEDGRELYMESSEVDWSIADTWILTNIKPHLKGETFLRSEIREQVREFIGNDREPEIIAYNGAFDWVALTQLFGRLLDIPKNWPKRHTELKELRKRKGNPKLPPKVGTHHLAIDDARWNKTSESFLQELPDVAE